MEIEQRQYRFRVAATETAFTRNAEFRPIPLCSFHSRTRPRDTVSEVNKSKIEVSSWWKSEILQRGEVRLVLSPARHWHVDPLYRPTTALDYGVRQFHRQGEITRLH